jgi:diamine N-acetyltransferase
MQVDAGLVSLQELTSETVIAVTRLAVAENQNALVAPNSVSLAQALFAAEAWYRGIYYGDNLVGFVMLEDESLRSPPPKRPGVGLWRFMIDAKYQGRGIGRAAMLQVIEHVRAKGVFESLELSYVPGPGSPEPFYLALGFRHTGRLDGKEVVLELPLVRRLDVTTSAQVFEGSCHCGAIGFTFRTLSSPDSWRVRACQCRFCRRHGARTTADPNGNVSFRVSDDSQVQRYRFALGTADFLLCRECGVYIAAVLTSPRGQFSTVNVNTISGLRNVADAAATSYDGESSDQRQQRRQCQWTPVVNAA